MSEVEIGTGGTPSNYGVGTITGVLAGDGLFGSAYSGVALIEINHSYSNSFLAAQSITVPSITGQVALTAIALGSRANAIDAQTSAIDAVSVRAMSEYGKAASFMVTGSAFNIVDGLVTTVPVVSEVIRLSKLPSDTMQAGTGLSQGFYTRTSDTFSSTKSGSIQSIILDPLAASFSSNMILSTSVGAVMVPSLTLRGANALLPTSGYLNFGLTDSESGYGIRDYLGKMQFRHSTGIWTDMGGGGGIGGGLGFSALHYSLDGKFFNIESDGYISNIVAKKSLFAASPAWSDGVISMRPISELDLPVIPISRGGTDNVTAMGALMTLLPSHVIADANKILCLDSTSTYAIWRDVFPDFTEEMLPIVPIIKGGTGSITAESAILALLPSVIGNENSSLKVVEGKVAWSANGILPIISGGTESNTPMGALLNLLPSLIGNDNKILTVNEDTSMVEWASAGDVGTSHPTLSDLSFDEDLSGHFAASTGTVANTFLGGPDGSDGIPSFRLLTSNDIPILLENVLPIVPIIRGGTGSITAEAATLALLPSINGNEDSSLKVIGGKISWATSGILPIIKGGTESNTPMGALLNLLPPLVGNDNKILTVNEDTSMVEWGSAEAGASHPELTDLSLRKLNVISGLYEDVSGHFAVTTTLANTFLGGPDGASGSPSFRALSLVDLPELTEEYLPIIPIIRGGTGSITASAAINALLPDQTDNNGKFLKSYNNVASWSSDSDFVDLYTVQNILGSKIFNSLSIGEKYGFRIIGSNYFNYMTLAYTGTSDIKYTFPVPSAGYLYTDVNGNLSWSTSIGYFSRLIHQLGTFYQIYPTITSDNLCVGGFGISALGYPKILGQCISDTTGQTQGVLGLCTGSSNFTNKIGVIGIINTCSGGDSLTNIGVRGLNFQGGYGGVFESNKSSSDSIYGGRSVLCIRRSGHTDALDNGGSIDFFIRSATPVYGSTPIDARISVTEGPVPLTNTRFCVYMPNPGDMNTPLKAFSVDSYYPLINIGGIYDTYGAMPDFTLHSRYLCLSYGTLSDRFQVSTNLTKNHIYRLPTNVVGVGGGSNTYSLGYVASNIDQTVTGVDQVSLEWISSSSSSGYFTYNDTNNVLMADTSTNPLENVYWYRDSTSVANLPNKMLYLSESTNALLIGWKPGDSELVPQALEAAKLLVYLKNCRELISGNYSSAGINSTNSSVPTNRSFGMFIKNDYHSKTYNRQYTYYNSVPSSNFAAGVGLYSESNTAFTFGDAWNSDYKGASGAILGSGQKGTYGLAGRTIRPLTRMYDTRAIGSTIDEDLSATVNVGYTYESVLDKRYINDLDGPSLFTERLLPNTGTGSLEGWSDSFDSYITKCVATTEGFTAAKFDGIGVSQDFMVGTMESGDKLIHVNHGTPQGRIKLAWHVNDLNLHHPFTNSLYPSFEFYLYSKSTQFGQTFNFAPFPILKLSASPMNSVSDPLPHDNCIVRGSSFYGSVFTNLWVGSGIAGGMAGSALTAIKYSNSGTGIVEVMSARADLYGSTSFFPGFGVSFAYVTGSVAVNSPDDGVGTYEGGEYRILARTIANSLTNSSGLVTSSFDIRTMYLQRGVIDVLTGLIDDTPTIRFNMQDTTTANVSRVDLTGARQTVKVLGFVVDSLTTTQRVVAKEQVVGRICLDTTADKLYFYSNTGWHQIISA